MDIDLDEDSSGDSTDNTMADQAANQPIEQNESINLLKLPTEVLEHILIHLKDKDLLSASHVCKLFASVVEAAVKRKYSEQCYFHAEYKKSFDKIMLTK